jgi:tetratricopeptide (TPR) repeat protein
MLLCLCGKSDGADRMEDVFSHIQELPVSDDMKKNGLGACFTYCMQLNLFLGKLDKAIECFLKLKDESLGKTEASAVSQNNLFYCALISMANQRRGRRVSFQMPIKSEVKRYVDAIKHLIEGGAINLGHKYLLVEAEFDALTSKEPEQTLRKYEQAVAAAAKAGFLQDGALASLLCGQFCMETDEIKERASTQILRAHELFVSWGATAVAESLLKRFPESFPDGFDHHRRISSSLRSRPHFREAVILKHKSLHAQRSARR